MKQRNIAVCIILTFLTCGIYGLYWLVKLNDETNDAVKEEGPSGIVVLLLTLVTCGIYGWYWYFKMGEKVNKMKGDDNNHILFIVLGICGLGIINYCIIQDALNKQVPTFEVFENAHTAASPSRLGEVIEEAADEAEKAVEEVGEAAVHMAEDAKEAISEVAEDVKEKINDIGK